MSTNQKRNLKNRRRGSKVSKKTYSLIFCVEIRVGGQQLFSTMICLGSFTIYLFENIITDMFYETNR